MNQLPEMPDTEVCPWASRLTSNTQKRVMIIFDFLVAVFVRLVLILVLARVQGKSSRRGVLCALILIDLRRPQVAAQ